jgi:colanic acid/amylovoran biosynthesis protein
MKKALLYACIENNIGDDLFIYTICKRYPDYYFYVSSEAKYGSLKDIENLRFSYIFNIWQKAANFGNRRGLKLFVSKILTSIFSVYLKKFSTSIYVVGNAFKCYNYQGKNQSEWFKQRVSLTKNFYLISTNFGPYSDFQWVIDFKEHFRKATNVCFRDEVSYNLFKDLENVSWAPDAVLSLGHRENTKNLSKKKILISIIDCSYETRPNYIKKHQYEYEKKLIELSNYYLNKEYTVNILTSNNLQDYPAAKRIQNECFKQSGKAPGIIEYEGDYDQIFEEYRKSDYIIATRLHAIILAWIYNLPVIPIIYDIKVRTLLNAYMFENLSIELESINNVSVDDVDEALKNYNFKNLDNLYRDANNQFKELDKILL